jgi:hypothetical protein
MRTIRLLVLSTLLAATAFVSAGPPWISIEYPGNPYDTASREAYLLVHAFHHGTPVGFPVSGSAEGVVKGDRRTVSLEFKTTTRPGVYSLTKQWPSEGTWTLVIGATQGAGEHNTAYALVEIGAAGQVASVTVPTVKKNGYTLPAAVRMADVDAALRTRADRVADR